jgi:RNA polymerase sigma factor (sigma-70 family)
MQQEEWPGPDDRPVVEEMLAHPDSPHWEKCYEFIRRVVQQISLSREEKEDVVQITMIKIHRKLSDFKFEGKLIHWLAKIARHATIDVIRKRKNNDLSLQLLGQSSSKDGEKENQAETRVADTRLTPENVHLSDEKVREIMDNIKKYIKTHKNPEQNKALVELVLFEEKACEEAARELGIPPPVAHYYIRRLRQYLKEQENE